MSLRLLILGLIVPVLFLQAGAASAEDGRWLRAESANFVIYKEGGERSLREAARTLENFDALARRLTRIDEPRSPVKLHIYLLRNSSSLRIVLPEAPEELAGFYSYNADFVAAFAIHDDYGWRGGAQQILFHEYAHHFMMQYLSGAYPAWFVEGFAEYLSTVQFERNRALVGRPSGARAVTLLRDELLPMRHILDPPRQMTSRQREMFYAQSWLLVHFIFSNAERLQAGRAYLTALSQGGDQIEAFEASFSTTLDAFLDQLAAYRRGSIGYLIFNDYQMVEPELTLTRLPESADSLLLRNARLRRARGGADAEAAAAEVLERAVRHAGEDYAERSAAYAEMFRDPEAARRRLSPLLTANADDPEANYIMGRSHVIEAMRSEEAFSEQARAARRYFARAFRSDPDSAPTLYYYAWTYQREPMPPTVLDVLIRAHVLAPQVMEIRFNLALQLMQAERFEEAAILLRPLIFSPHNPELADRVRALLDAAEQRTMPSP